MEWLQERQFFEVAVQDSIEDLCEKIVFSPEEVVQMIKLGRARRPHPRVGAAGQHRGINHLLDEGWVGNGNSAAHHRVCAQDGEWRSGEEGLVAYAEQVCFDTQSLPSGWQPSISAPLPFKRSAVYSELPLDDYEKAESKTKVARGLDDTQRQPFSEPLHEGQRTPVFLGHGLGTGAGATRTDNNTATDYNETPLSADVLKALAEQREMDAQIAAIAAKSAPVRAMIKEKKTPMINRAFSSKLPDIETLQERLGYVLFNEFFENHSPNGTLQIMVNILERTGGKQDNLYLPPTTKFKIMLENKHDWGKWTCENLPPKDRPGVSGDEAGPVGFDWTCFRDHFAIPEGDRALDEAAVFHDKVLYQPETYTQLMDTAISIPYSVKDNNGIPYKGPRGESTWTVITNSC
jgi:hypothetical protein